MINYIIIKPLKRKYVYKCDWKLIKSEVWNITEYNTNRDTLIVTTNWKHTINKLDNLNTRLKGTYELKIYTIKDEYLTSFFIGIPFK